MVRAALLLLCGIIHAASAQQNNSCIVRNADIVFVIDSSGSVSPPDYAKALNFTAQLAKDFDIGPQKVRVALVEYSTNAMLVFDFNKYSSSNDVVQAILRTAKTDGNTATHLALQQAEMALASARPNVPKILFVMTDGSSNNGNFTEHAAKSIKAKGTSVFAVGIGSVSPSELQAIASDPSQVFIYTNFAQLSLIKEQFSKKFCEVAVQLETQYSCQLKKADITFIIDSSGSITTADYNKSLEFIASLAQSYDIGPNNIRVGVIEFSTGAVIHFPLNRYTTKADVVAAIRRTPKTSLGTSTHSALQLARTMMLTNSSGMRPDVPQLIFVFTDGESNVPLSTLAEAKLLQSQGVNIISVGIGAAKEAELKAIASSPQFVYNFTSFDELTKMQSTFANETCRVAAEILLTTPKTPNCTLKAADVAFILDSSGSVSSQDYNKSLHFVANLVQTFDLGPNKVRVGLIEYSNAAQIIFNFLNYTTAQELTRAILATPKTNGGTETAGALQLARTKLFDSSSGSRTGVPHVLYVITDGASNSFTLTVNASKLLHQKGINVISVGVGNANPKELQEIASNPKFVYNFTDFNELSKQQDLFTEQLCEVESLVTTPAPCKLKVADVAFIMDSSGSVTNDDYNKSLDFVSRLVQTFDLGPNKVRVGLIEYSSAAQIIFNFLNYTTAQELTRAILATPKTNGGTQTDAALNLAGNTLFTSSSGSRSRVPLILYVITDGASNSLPATAAASKLLHQKGINVISVGVGNANPKELQEIASNPNFVFNFTNFNELSKQQELFAEQLCEVESIITTAPPPACDLRAADIAFVLDASGSVSPRDYNKSLVFVSRLVEKFDVRPSAVQIAVIEYSSSPHIHFTFNRFSTLKDVQSAIITTPKSGGGTNTHTALELARNQVFNSTTGSRVGVPHILFVITDGVSSNRLATVTAAKSLHQDGVTVFAIGVGNADRKELLSIASEPLNVQSVDNFDNLTLLLESFSEEMCDVANQITTPSTRCEIKKADVAFILDESSSISVADFDKMLDFVAKLVKGFDVGFNDVRVAAIGFSSNSTIQFDFTAFNSTLALQQKILQIQKNTGGSTRTHDALDLARTKLFNVSSGMRVGVPHIAIVITDGESDFPAQTASSAKLLHQSGVNVLSFGIGAAKPSELLAIASSPRYFYNFTDFDELIGVSVGNLFLKEACDELQPTTTQTPCSVSMADIGIVVDASGSVGRPDYIKALDFFSKLVEGFKVGHNDAQVGVIEFSDKATVHFLFNNFHSTKDVVEAIKRTPKSNRGTNTNLALDLASKELFNSTNGMRNGVPKILLVMTDGASANFPKTSISAGNLHKRGITVFALGIGNANMKELRAIASNSSLVYLINNFDELKNVKDQLMKQLCSTTVELFTTTTAIPAVCDETCVDKASDCSLYSMDDCRDPAFRVLLETNCKMHCGFCRNEPGCITVTQNPCVDKPECFSFDDVICKLDPGFAKEICPNRCGFCSTTPVVATTKSCVDKRDCSIFPDEFCKEKEYRSFMLTECKQYCDLCNEDF